MIPFFAAGALNSTIGDAIFSNYLPIPFIASAERHGAAIFQWEIDFARNRLLEEMGRANPKIDPQDLLFKAYQSYPIPIEESVDFIRQLENVAKEESFLAKEHPEVLDDFAAIIGGEYTITQTTNSTILPKGRGSN